MRVDKTSMSRNRLSAPAQWLHDNGYLRGKILDYGCGRGDLRKFLHPLIDEWDPYWTPDTSYESLLDQYDTVVMTYVLNVLDRTQWKRVIKKAMACLRARGKLYIAVRRDYQHMGDGQYAVNLDLPVVMERKGRFCIYLADSQR